ncbi:hypothetical protein K2173_000612 [Erythroxylum novogranatense]|uniref:Uncharacterized protein n=1 Tax=Erythroxylum novogranatense TaxID=1862640 RepID=A0AAV8S7Y9_9ROSI|nr:hypothetical protein K2173_000612 [Erythroxylum novogranatense]
MNMVVHKLATQGRGGVGSMGVSGFTPSPAYLSRYATRRTTFYNLHMQMVSHSMTLRRCISCSAVQESSSYAVAAENEKKEVKAVETKEPVRPKPAAKAPPKPLPRLMDEDVLPSLKTTLEAEEDITELDLSFQDNRLEGSFLKKGKPYSFWAFFPNGVLTGPKGFSLSSYGSEVSTVEPFLIDEKKITGKHIVFWVRKRLAAQGIIPVWDKKT